MNTKERDLEGEQIALRVDWITRVPVDPLPKTLELREEIGRAAWR